MEVAQTDDPDLQAGLVLDLTGDIEAMAVALGHHDDAVRLAPGVGPKDAPADLLKRHLDLGHQDRLRPRCKPGVERDVAGVPAHRLDHADALVAGGGVPTPADVFSHRV